MCLAAGARQSALEAKRIRIAFGIEAVKMQIDLCFEISGLKNLTYSN